jgi:hypothetical protein
VLKGRYLTNLSTVKNRKARENKSRERLELEKAKTIRRGLIPCSLILSSRRRRFNYVSRLLTTCMTLEKKTKLEKEL